METELKREEGRTKREKGRLVNVEVAAKDCSGFVLQFSIFFFPIMGMETELKREEGRTKREKGRLVSHCGNSQRLLCLRASFFAVPFFSLLVRKRNSRIKKEV
ncbi:MAG: hypothetical protein AAF609_14450 [Cyanobacteria bacterium P01_C01_bin.120]